MKKLFSLALVIAVFFALTGCTEQELPTEQIQELEALLEEKQTELDEYSQAILALEAQLNELEASLGEKTQTIEDLHSEIVTLGTEIYVLERDILELEEQIFDNIITFTFNDSYGTYVSDTVAYNDDFDGTLFDLLDQNFSVSYMTTEYGPYITGLEHISTMYGNYIAFYKNDEMSMVGVDTATFDDGDVFSFELMWWDQTAKMVYEAIELFVSEQADSYVSDTSADYNVMSGLYLLGNLDEFITQSELEALVDTSSLTTNADYFKAITRLSMVGSDTSTLLTTFSSSAVTGSYGNTAYGLLALDSVDHPNDYSAFVTSALTSFDTESPYDLGLDAGGVSLVALSNYVGQGNVDALITEYVDWVKADQLASGGIQTRDVIWGETTYPGTENAASISQVILGLIAVGENPGGMDYQQGTNTLISRLIEFQNEDGSFDYLIADENADLLFSTPQAFLALVAYQEYLNNGNQGVNPFQY